jgi:hypothetical protein
VSPLAVVLLVAALALVGATEWPRLQGLRGERPQVARTRRRSRSKAKLELLSPPGEVPDHEEFARSVERDLAALPTIDERDPRR